jgi:hypothetical protein
MDASRPFGSSVAPLATFAAGAVVTAVLVVAWRSAPEPRTAERAVMPVRQVQDASPALEPPARAPAAPASVLPTVAPSPPLPVEARQPDTGALVEDVQQLRDEVARLKQELGQARSDSQTAVLWDVDRQVAGIRAQLAENQAYREENSEAAQRAAAQRHEAVQMLFAAQRRLMTGDSQVLDALDAAAPALPYPAQSALRNARDRVESEDLYAARYWIGVAIVESGWSQLVQ